MVSSIAETVSLNCSNISHILGLQVLSKVKSAKCHIGIAIYMY